MSRGLDEALGVSETRLGPPGPPRSTGRPSGIKFKKIKNLFFLIEKSRFSRFSLSGASVSAGYHCISREALGSAEVSGVGLGMVLTPASVRVSSNMFV